MFGIEVKHQHVQLYVVDLAEKRVLLQPRLQLLNLDSIVSVYAELV